VGSEGAKRTGGSGGSTRWRVRALIITLAIHHRKHRQALAGALSPALLPRCGLRTPQNLRFAIISPQYMSDFSNVRSWLGRR
jgi:hypothetical protein